jgi:hypothetical protein
MSNLIEYIKRQRAAGLDDYQIMKNAKYSRTVNEQVGGFFEINEVDQTGKPSSYAEFIEDEPTGIYYNPFEDSFYTYDVESGELQGVDDPGAERTITRDNMPLREAVAMDMEKAEAIVEEIVGEITEKTAETVEAVASGEIPVSDALSGNVPEKEKDITSANAYTTIPMGTLLFHPSSDVRTISGNTALFVKLPKVLDMSKQRSFTMFFTPNREYARRFAGIQSLDKRDVYVHELMATKAIPNIKRIDSDLVEGNIDNIDLGKGFCGPSVDGEINGIHLAYHTAKGGVVDEFYICNPERFFEIMTTEMQLNATEWIDISKDARRQMHIEPEEGEASMFGRDEPQGVSGAVDDIPLAMNDPAFEDTLEAAEAIETAKDVGALGETGKPVETRETMMETN